MNWVLLALVICSLQHPTLAATVTDSAECPPGTTLDSDQLKINGRSASAMCCYEEKRNCIEKELKCPVGYKPDSLDREGPSGVLKCKEDGGKEKGKDSEKDSKKSKKDKDDVDRDRERDRDRDRDRDRGDGDLVIQAVSSATAIQASTTGILGLFLLLSVT
jgi:hypothetical protein